MKSRSGAFNFFLLLAAVALLTSCATSDERQRKKEYSNIRIHIEADASGDRSSAVSIHRAAPVLINIEREPVLDEHQVLAAMLVEQPGGFAIQVQFNRQGSWLLERTTVTHRGRHLVIFSHFGESRWLAAPLITGKNSSGRLTFTPDATREEAERIVRGLNNVARKLEKKEKWPLVDQWER